MMTMTDWMFVGVDAALWYTFLYYFLYSIKKDVNLFKSAFVLLIILYAAFIACPWMRATDAWIRLFG